MTQQPIQQPYPDPLGSLVKGIREGDLRLSQENLAWLASVSRNTISNLERGAVIPDARTWRRIRTALALLPISLEQAREGGATQFLINADAVRGIVEAILAIRDRDPALGRSTAERWQQLVEGLTGEKGLEWAAASTELTWLAREVADQAPPGKASIIRAALRDRGWLPTARPADDLAVPVTREGLTQVEKLLTTVNDMTERLRVYQAKAQAFDRLAPVVRDRLALGHVLAFEITTPETASEASLINLLVLNRAASSLAAEQEALDAARRWTVILRVATHIVEKQAPNLSPEEIIMALQRGLDARSSAEIHELLPLASGGDLTAMYNLARLLRKNGRVQEADHWLRRCAEGGHPGALFTLGGLAIKDGRLNEAKHWLSSAADAGHPEAMYSLWGLLRSDDPVRAKEWLDDSASAGNRNAMYCLWVLHRQGGDHAEARRWLRRAANRGHRQALDDLSKLDMGSGSEEEAARWLHLAAEAGDTGVMARFESILYERKRQEAAFRPAG